MKVEGFHHLALKVEDVERVAAFYREVLGLPELTRHHRQDGTLRSIWLSVPSSAGGFLAIEALGEDSAEGSASERPGWHLLALRIRPEDRAATEAELTRRGHAIVHRTRWTLYVHDPEGNRVGLSHHPDDAPVEAVAPGATRG